MKAAIRTVSLFLPESRSNALRVPATLFLLSAAPKHSRGTLICPQIYSLCRDSCNFLGVLWAQVLIKKKGVRGISILQLCGLVLGIPAFFYANFVDSRIGYVDFVVVMDQASENSCKQRWENDIPKGSQLYSDQIMPHILNL